jgi:uncharacterized membrane protein YecN with MAPEG domain
MSLVITPAYAGVLGLAFLALSLRVIQGRRKMRVDLGDGGHRALMRRQRVQGNFAEYVPLVLVLMTLAELQGGRAWTIHLVGAALLLGRVLHGYGVSRDPEPFVFRMVGMMLTFAALIIGAFTNLILVDWSAFGRI